MGVPKEIFIIRHGQTAYNQQGIVQGKGVDSVLNDTGRKQAADFFERYKNAGFEKVFISTLTRTEQTAQPFLDLGLPFEKRSELDEIDWGVHEGNASDSDSKSGYFEMVKAWRDGDLDRKIPGGESPKEVAQRQMPFLEELKNMEHSKLLLVIHGRAIRILMCQLMGEGLEAMDKYPHRNTGLYKLAFDGEKYEVLLANDSSHLSE